MESVRFLVIGGCNTLFGVVNSLAMVQLMLWLRPDQPKTMGTVAIALSSVINIGFSFLAYKWFVFRTKGNYLKEYLRSLLIYLPNLAASTLAVAPLTAVLKRWTGHDRGSVYGAVVIIVIAGIIFSFFGHKNVTFRRDGRAEAGTD